MKCIILGLKPNVRYAFIRPYGVELRTGQTLILDATKGDNVRNVNRLELEVVGKTDRDRLRYGQYEIAAGAVKTTAPTAPVEVKEMAVQSDKSMAGKKKSKSKKGS